MDTTDVKSKIGIAEMRTDEVDKQLANDYLLFTKAFTLGFGSCSTSLQEGGPYD